MRSASSVWSAAGGRSSAVGRRLVDDRQRRQRADARRPGRFHPLEPIEQKRLVDAGDRREAAARVAVHRGVADGRLAAVAGREQQRAAKIGQQPNARPAGTGLDVLQRHIVVLPVKLAADRVRDGFDVLVDHGVHVPLEELGAHGLGHGFRRVAAFAWPLLRVD